MASRFARVALALERYRLAKGRLPDTLDELAPRWIPETPPDPFTGGSLLYEKTELEFTVTGDGTAYRTNPRLEQIKNLGIRVFHRGGK